MQIVAARILYEWLVGTTSTEGSLPSDLTENFKTWPVKGESNGILMISWPSFIVKVEVASQELVERLK